MKSKYTFKRILVILIFFCSVKSYTQVTVKITNMNYESIAIAECGRVDLKSKNNHNLTFNVVLEKQFDSNNANNINDLYANGDIEIILGALGTLRTKKITNVSGGNWTANSNITMSVSFSYSVSISSTELSINQNNIFAIYESNTGNINQSCEHNITKPKFIMNQGSVEVICDSTSPVTFSVNNFNNSSGNLSFNWEVGSGWERNGNPVSNFTTTTNSISLKPTSYPPSNLSVTPVLDGVSYTKLTTSVSVGNFNPNYIITGSTNLCNADTYSVNNLPSGTNIVSWSSSNPNIVSLNTTNLNQPIVSKIDNGNVTISAVLENSCGQIATITKNIEVGLSSINSLIITGSESICNNRVKTYSLNLSAHPCVNNVNWSVSPNITILSQTTNSITVESNTTNLADAGFINVNIPDLNFELNKGVWVGLPKTRNLSLNKISTYSFQEGEWSRLQSNYSAIMYAFNQPNTYTYEWKIPNSQVRNFSNDAIKDVKPYFFGQLNIGVRVSNSCGCSSWKYTLFDVIPMPNNGGGGGAIIKVKD
jgi:hypothetical protein